VRRGASRYLERSCQQRASRRDRHQVGQIDRACGRRRADRRPAESGGRWGRHPWAIRSAMVSPWAAAAALASCSNSNRLTVSWLTPKAPISTMPPDLVTPAATRSARRDRHGALPLDPPVTRDRARLDRRTGCFGHRGLGAADRRALDARRRSGSRRWWRAEVGRRVTPARRTRPIGRSAAPAPSKKLPLIAAATVGGVALR